MKTIAIYGKGGIGKSTIAANISATLGSLGNSILQVGCDPKHDSTFMLTKQTQMILLEVLKEKGEEITINDIMLSSEYGVDCLELGGPEPGIGCAGRGIIKGIEIINKLGIMQKKHYDLTIFDTLGDVVCGGFFEPLRKGKTDEMFIVTSGEFNSLFAANNLIKGYINNATTSKEVVLGGIIGNCRGVKNENIILKEFSKITGVPLIAIIPRDIRFEQCSVDNVPIISAHKDSDLHDIFITLCNKVIAKKGERTKVTSLSFDNLRDLFKKLYMQD